MEKNVFIDKLNRAFRENGYEYLLDENKSEKLWKLACLLVETNKVTNLTAITDENGIILKHFLDSSVVAPLIPDNANVIDIGCGAGFPSLPLAVLRDDLKLVSLDSTGKKIDFVNFTAIALGLKNLQPVCARAEEYVVACRESFDVSVSRAVARLNVLAEISIPFLKIGGLFLPMKAANKGAEELGEAEHGISVLGAELFSQDSLNLHFEGESIEREIYAFKKARRTPNQYPRKYAQILKKPL